MFSLGFGDQGLVFLVVGSRMYDWGVHRVLPAVLPLDLAEHHLARLCLQKVVKGVRIRESMFGGPLNGTGARRIYWNL